VLAGTSFGEMNNPHRAHQLYGIVPLWRPAAIQKLSLARFRGQKHIR
jgi:hypothetical protein